MTTDLCIVPLKLGIRIDQQALILIYKDLQTNKTRKRIMPMKDSINILTDTNDLAKKLKEQIKYKFYLNKVNDKRIEKCLFLLQDSLKGYKLDESLERANELFVKNINKLNDNEECEDNDNNYYDFYKRNITDNNNASKVEANDFNDFNDNSF
jgi:hypothetical protein